MGDKGGKKDKEKNKQQHDKKHKDEEQRKQDEGPAPRARNRAEPGMSRGLIRCVAYLWAAPITIVGVAIAIATWSPRCRWRWWTA